MGRSLPLLAPHPSHHQELANDPATVYKLFGRVLVKQEASEAKATVDSRIAFIQTEMCVWGWRRRDWEAERGTHPLCI